MPIRSQAGPELRAPAVVLRRLPVGAEVLDGDATHFRVWAPARRLVEVVIESGAGPAGAHELAPEGNGYFSGVVDGARAGTRYRFRLDGGAELYPDPASRFQPDGPTGPSEVIDPSAFEWTDATWTGVPEGAEVIYEMHVGTFTAEGTWAAATARLPALAELGITIIEMMPVAEFPGRFGWGYDGVNLFAPTRLYGTPDDLRRFVDTAHGLGIGVILDVVYNHLGPSGNCLMQFSESYFSRIHRTEWGDALNFDGPDCEPVREFFLANAGYWIDEFHFDGLRLDATQSIYDDSPVHILAEIGDRVRTTGRGRRTFVVVENEPQDVRMIRARADGGFGFDAAWNDDFHHTARVALTGRDEAYYSDYRGSPQEFISAAKYGFLYQGQRYHWQDQRRGTPTAGLPPRRFVHFLQNHDQVANSVRGDRIHMVSSPGRLRAMTALLLLGPQIPMLFQGQEFAASSPFLYFADHEPELAALIRTGRREFLHQFPSIAQPEVADQLAPPDEPDTYERSKLRHEERNRWPHAAVYALHRDLLELRRNGWALDARTREEIDGAVLAPHAFALRLLREGAERLLVVNLGGPLHANALPEPLMAPPAGHRWRLRWSSEDLRYGGLGMPEPEDEDGIWSLPGDSAVLLVPERCDD